MGTSVVSRILCSTVITLGGVAVLTIVEQVRSLAMPILLIPGAVIATVAVLVLDTLGVRGVNLPVLDEFEGPAQFMLISLAFGLIVIWTIVFWALTRRSRRVLAMRPSDRQS